jgi:hypothetical protein
MPDAETQKLIQEAQHVEAMLTSQGWQLVKAKLDARILDLQNINNIDTSHASTLETQLLGRKLASELLFDFLKRDVYGFVEQARTNSAAHPVKEDALVERHEENA